MFYSSKARQTGKSYNNIQHLCDKHMQSNEIIVGQDISENPVAMELPLYIKWKSNSFRLTKQQQIKMGYEKLIQVLPMPKGIDDQEKFCWLCPIGYGRNYNGS